MYAIDPFHFTNLIYSISNLPTDLLPTSVHRQIKLQERWMIHRASIIIDSVDVVLLGIGTFRYIRCLKTDHVVIHEDCIFTYCNLPWQVYGVSWLTSFVLPRDGSTRCVAVRGVCGRPKSMPSTPSRTSLVQSAGRGPGGWTVRFWFEVVYTHTKLILLMVQKSG